MPPNIPARRWNPRAFVSLVIALCAAGLPVTGLANHALQLEMTRERHAWMSAHNSLGVVFVVFVAWHLILNRRALVAYLRGAATGLPGVAHEARWALAVVGVTTALAAGHALVVP